MTLSPASTSETPRIGNVPRCTRAKYVSLAIILGPLGLHNFAAGYRFRGLIQLGISVASMGLLSPVAAVWALFEAAFTRTDATGVPFHEAPIESANPEQPLLRSPQSGLAAESPTLRRAA